MYNPKCNYIDCTEAKQNNFNNLHIVKYRHLCLYKDKCPFIYDINHLQLFFHEITEKQVSEERNFKFISEKKKCPNFENCQLLSDSSHKESYFHLCKNGKDCKIITDEKHIHRFVHPCSKGKNCQEKDSLHILQFLHFKDLQICTNPKTCKDQTKLHAFSYRHICTTKACTKKNDEEHTHLFLHTCKHGEQCRGLKNMDLKHLQDFYHEIGGFWPSSWINPPSEKDSPKRWKSISLSSKSEEYQNVAKKFKLSIGYRVSNPKIISIERNENFELWTNYVGFKSAIKLQTKSNEKFLYHGTDETTIQSIVKLGFNHRIGDMKTAKYGAGTYFATQAGKSNHFSIENTNKEKRMILARVELGDVFQTQGTMIGARKPPTKPNSQDSFHSVMSPDSQEYVSFDNNQSYPEYVITYKE
jgi:hypothetical protein